jgi:hypothetical protein
MDSAEHCRIQAEECRRLLALAQNEAEASVLKYLARSWVGIANQLDRYVEIVKGGRLGKSKGPSQDGSRPPHHPIQLVQRSIEVRCPPQPPAKPPAPTVPREPSAASGAGLDRVEAYGTFQNTIFE